MAGQGSTGNVIAAVCSFFVPGLGQLVQGRMGMAMIQFALAVFLWFFLLGWVIHLWSILDAALWKPPAVLSWVLLSSGGVGDTLRRRGSLQIRPAAPPRAAALGRLLDP